MTRLISSIKAALSCSSSFIAVMFRRPVREFTSSPVSLSALYYSGGVVLSSKVLQDYWSGALRNLGGNPKNGGIESAINVQADAPHARKSNMSA